MPIHNFDADFSAPYDNRIPISLPSLPSVSQLSHSSGKRTPFDGSDQFKRSVHVEEFTTAGFRSLDENLKQYWTGIKVPTKDSYRLLRVKIAGGDKSLLIWSDDLKEGRARLPVASINRTSHEFLQEKFSPTYHPMTYRYLNTDRTLVAQVFRPVPYLVSYEMSVWAERKRDMEHIMFQILQRFNPIAEFRMYDGHLQGSIYLRYKGMTDNSDKEASADTHANVRYEVTFDAEAWLPLPERIVPTVRGVVTNLRESFGELIEQPVIDSNSGASLGLRTGNYSIAGLPAYF
jgi:hypothetical protein